MTISGITEYVDSAHKTLREAVEKITVVPSLKPDDAATCVKIAQQAWNKGASKAAAVAAARRYAVSRLPDEAA